MSHKAIAYTSDIIIGRTGGVVSRREQRAAIEQHAKESGSSPRKRASRSSPGSRTTCTCRSS